jgi:hypothetical protein
VKRSCQADWSWLGAQVVVESTGIHRRPAHLKGTVKGRDQSASVDGTFYRRQHGPMISKAQCNLNTSTATNCPAPLKSEFSMRSSNQSGFRLRFTLHKRPEPADSHRDLRRAPRAINMVTALPAPRRQSIDPAETRRKLMNWQPRSLPNVSLVDLVARPCQATGEM